MADGIQVPTAKELGLNTHVHKAGEASKVATTQEELDKLLSSGWSKFPVGWVLYGPRGTEVTVYTAGQEADALAQGYSIDPPVQVESVTLKNRALGGPAAQRMVKADA